MALSRVIFTVPLLYQQLFYCPIEPPPPPPPEPPWIVQTTTAFPLGRTLFYQANIAPPPQEVPIPVDNINAATTITSGAVRTRNLFYQSKVFAHTPPVEVVVADVATYQWQQPFSRAVQRPLTETGLYTPFVPSAFPQPTVDEWLQPFRRQVAGPYPVHTQPILSYAAAPQVTPDEWLQPFRRAVQIPQPIHTQPVSGYQPEAVVVSNLTTTLEWLQPFQKAVPPPRAALSQPVSGYQPEAAVVSNLTTTLEWMQAWRGPPRVLPVHTQPVHAHLLPNLTTTLEWQIAWQKAVPAPKPIHTQPILGYPYEAAENTRTEWDWSIAWQGPPRTLQRLAAGAGFSLPPSNYRNEWDWPLAWNLAAKAPKPVHTQPVSGYPYVTIENTITGIAWLYRFEKAVPAPPVRHTQPVFGYPYVAVTPPSNLTTTLEWLQAWQGPPRTLQRLSAGPALPPAATPTIANTITGIAWLQGWQGPPRYWPLKVQQTPFIPKEFVQDRVTPDKWLQAWQKAVPAPRPIATQPILGRSDAAPPRLEWLRGFDRPVAARPVTASQPSFVYAPAAVVSNLTTTLEWQQPLSAVVQRQTARPTQPVFGYPYEVAPVVTAEVGGVFAVTTAYPHHQRTLFYQAWTFGYPYEQVAPVCIPAFQIEAVQFDAFQTCADEQETEPPVPGVFSVTTAYPLRRSLFYQAHVWAPQFIEPPPPPPFEVGGSLTVTTTFTLGRTLFYQANVWAPQVVAPPPPEPEPPPPVVVPKFSHGQVHAAKALTAISVVHPEPGAACIPGFQSSGFDSGYQTCLGATPPATPPVRRLRTTSAMTSTRWNRSRGGIRSRGKSRTTPRDDP